MEISESDFLLCDAFSPTAFDTNDGDGDVGAVPSVADPVNDPVNDPCRTSLVYKELMWKQTVSIKSGRSVGEISRVVVEC